MKIGVFDSGIGGMTVLYQALKILPHEDYLYYADTEHVPYGEKSKEEVRQFVFEAAGFIASHNVKALVVACNSATSAAIADLRKMYQFPILGIEPAVKPAIEKSHRGKRVLVLATSLTLREEKYNSLIARLDNEGMVDGLALPGLVEFAERFEFDEAVVMPYLEREFAPLALNEYEYVVLGCTHFPLFKDMIQRLMPPDIDIIDGGVGTARNLRRILAERSLLEQGSGQIEYYSSGMKVVDRQIIAQYAKLLERLDKVYPAQGAYA